MALLTWLSLAFLLVAGIGSVTYAGLRAWRTWRTFRSFSRAAADALTRVVQSAESAEAHATGVADGTARLEAANTRLERSLAELATLRAAAGETRGLFAGLRGAVPRK